MHVINKILVILINYLQYFSLKIVTFCSYKHNNCILTIYNEGYTFEYFLIGFLKKYFFTFYFKRALSQVEPI